MIRATASAATPRPTARNAPARRPLRRILLLLTVLALTGPAAVGQSAVAADRSYDDIWVNADGVAFQRDSWSDEVAYVVRPAGAHRGGQAYSRDLTRDEQNHGWTTFWEAKRAYPDGYCVVWVEVEDAGSWHESEGGAACTASRPTAPSPPTPTPTDTSADTRADTKADTKADKPAPVPVVTPRPTPRPTPEAGQPRATAPASTPSAAPAPAPTPTPTPTPTPSTTPSPSGSSTPSPSPSRTSPEVAPMQGMVEQQGPEAQAVPAGDGEVVSPLGWVAVLGVGALLTTGGLLLLWRRLT